MRGICQVPCGRRLAPVVCTFPAHDAPYERRTGRGQTEGLLLSCAYFLHTTRLPRDAQVERRLKACSCRVHIWYTRRALRETHRQSAYWRLAPVVCIFRKHDAFRETHRQSAYWRLAPVVCTFGTHDAPYDGRTDRAHTGGLLLSCAYFLHKTRLPKDAQVERRLKACSCSVHISYTRRLQRDAQTERILEACSCRVHNSCTRRAFRGTHR
jgi:aerobic-type carbon monoxide dehydrogenase small subunit (CoxS/CutS family)